MTNYLPPRPAPQSAESTPRKRNKPRKQILLSTDTLSALPKAVSIPAYDRSKLSAGIVHIGVGNFHRAHEALYVDRCLHLAGQEGWGIIGVGLSEGIEKLAKANAIKSQDGLYTLTEVSPDGKVATR